MSTRIKYYLTVNFIVDCGVYKRYCLINEFATDNNLDISCSTIASMVPVSDDDEREGEYDVVLNNPSYVDKKIQHTLNEVCFEVTSTIGLTIPCVL